MPYCTFGNKLTNNNTKLYNTEKLMSKYFKFQCIHLDIL